MPANPDKLRAARALIAAPGGWTQGASARDSNGRAIVSHSPSAVCFCSGGALFRVNGHYLENREALRRAMNCDNLVDWNDVLGRTQAEVVAAFDRAIALAEEEAEARPVL